jgi:hypothetical protein
MPIKQCLFREGFLFAGKTVILSRLEEPDE